MRSGDREKNRYLHRTYYRTVRITAPYNQLLASLGMIIAWLQKAMPDDGFGITGLHSMEGQSRFDEVVDQFFFGIFAMATAIFLEDGLTETTK